MPIETSSMRRSSSPWPWTDPDLVAQLRRHRGPRVDDQLHFGRPGVGRDDVADEPRGRRAPRDHGLAHLDAVVHTLVDRDRPLEVRDPVGDDDGCDGIGVERPAQTELVEEFIEAALQDPRSRRWSVWRSATWSLRLWFSSSSEGRWARPLKKSATGRVTPVTASWSGLMAACAERPTPASGPSVPCR